MRSLSIYEYDLSTKGIRHLTFALENKQVMSQFFFLLMWWMISTINWPDWVLWLGVNDVVSLVLSQ